MSLRDVVRSMLAGTGDAADAGRSDAQGEPGTDSMSTTSGIEERLDAEGHGELPAELFGTVLGHYADTAPLEEADALAPLVTRLSQVPFDAEFDGAAGEPLDDPYRLLDQVTGHDLGDEPAGDRPLDGVGGVDGGDGVDDADEHDPADRLDRVDDRIDHVVPDPADDVVDPELGRSADVPGDDFGAGSESDGRSADVDTSLRDEEHDGFSAGSSDVLTSEVEIDDAFDDAGDVRTHDEIFGSEAGGEDGSDVDPFDDDLAIDD